MKRATLLAASGSLLEFTSGIIHTQYQQLPQSVSIAHIDFFVGIRRKLPLFSKQTIPVFKSMKSPKFGRQ